MLDYAAAGPFTELGRVPAEMLGEVVGDPVAVCWPVHDLVVQPSDAERIGLSAERFATNQVRPARALLAALLALDPAPLTTPREPDRRIVGTCRHFAVLGCALLRHHGIAARVRCGFATYFRPGLAVDHWIVEHRREPGSAWARIDVELLGGDVERAAALAPGDFLSGGEAWLAYRRGEVDADTFGVHGTDNWGLAEIRGNAVKDLAALNKVEMLPWDEWGRMTQAYEGRTGSDYDELLDELARVCASNDAETIEAMYAHPDLTVPAAMIR